MRLLFYIGQSDWNGSARAFVAAARGVAKREHQVTLACPAGSMVERVASAGGLEVAPIAPGAGGTSGTWTLRRLMHDRFVEVAFVHGDREQFLVSSAMRLAERGAVIRRVPSFEPFVLRPSGRLALRMAAAGLAFTTETELQATRAPAFPLEPRVVPLGVDAAGYDSIRPVPRAALGLPAEGLLLVLSYAASARNRAIGVMRTLAALAPRHPEIRLVIIGAGSLDDDLRMHAAALGVHSLITYLGEREEALPVLRAADVGWVVGDADDGAFACLDYMAMRIPVLAERGAMPQHYVTDGIAGVLLAPGDAAHMAAAVASFLGHEDRRAAMGQAGRLRVQREFSESAMIDGFERAALAACDRARWAVR